MERAEWLDRLRRHAETLYDRLSPEYWVTFGLYENETHVEYLRKFLARLGPSSAVLSAACGAGRYDGFLLEAGHHVVGIDQSEGMLRRARQVFPAIRYEKMGLQEMDFRAAFDGAICMDAMENVPPEDWPGILGNFHAALKPDGVLYFTQEPGDEEDVQGAYERAKAHGLPVVYGELVDGIETAYEQAIASDSPAESLELSDMAVYHYYPAAEQVRAWLDEAGFAVEEHGRGSGYEHYLVRKRNA